MRFLRRRVPEPDPAAFEVRHGESTFQVAFRRRSTARRFTLRVSGATGAITLTAPPRAELAAVRPFLDAHAGWIAARVAKAPERSPFTPGAAVPLRGEPHIVAHRPGARVRTRLGNEPGGERAIVVGGDEASVPGRLRRFLAAEAERDLREAVARHAGRIGATVARVTVRDTTSRWGSCSSAGALSFSWRLILAPPFVLDYLAAHEVAHLSEMNHSPAFWRLTRELAPRTAEAEAWLKRHGTALHRYG